MNENYLRIEVLVVVVWNCKIEEILLKKWLKGKGN